jgi:hypothetical protein
MSGDYEDVPVAVRQAVVNAARTRGDGCLDCMDDLIESLPVTVVSWDDGGPPCKTRCEWGEDYAEVAEAEWSSVTYGDGDYCVTIRWLAEDAAGRKLGSGSFDIEQMTEEPDCLEGEHAWTAEHEAGCESNPGVWSTGGTSMLFVARCRHCGMERKIRVTGSQRNPGDCDTAEYSDPDPDWVEEHYPSR